MWVYVPRANVNNPSRERNFSIDRHTHDTRTHTPKSPWASRRAVCHFEARTSFFFFITEYSGVYHRISNAFFTMTRNGAARATHAHIAATMSLHALLVFLLVAASTRWPTCNGKHFVVDEQLDVEKITAHYRHLVAPAEATEKFTRFGRAIILSKEEAVLPLIECHSTIGRCILADNHYKINDEYWVERNKHVYCSRDLKPVILYEHVTGFTMQSYPNFYVLDWRYKIDVGLLEIQVGDVKNISLSVDAGPKKQRRTVQIVYKTGCKVETIYEGNKHELQPMEDFVFAEEISELHTFFTDFDMCPKGGRGITTWDVEKRRDVGPACFMKHLADTTNLTHKIGSRVEGVNYFDFFMLDRNQDEWNGYMIDYEHQEPNVSLIRMIDHARVRQRLYTNRSFLQLVFSFPAGNITGKDLQFVFNYEYTLACYGQHYETNSSLLCLYIDVLQNSTRKFTMDYETRISSFQLHYRKDGEFYLLINAARELESQRNIYELWRIKIDGRRGKAEEKRYDAFRVQRFLAPGDDVAAYIDHWDDDDDEVVCVSFECKQDLLRLHNTGRYASLRDYYFKRFYNKCFARKDFDDAKLKVLVHKRT
ncbi:unnamed protein product [Trichogramma brassicae]|uniref:Uncharacterized protein n=1 Tax=Trichogramma brassicae TaxID=86971 RepID=A0A6H5IF52_9HYME|nr:unnamed protein product [Trichogramma brassicae]